MTETQIAQAATAAAPPRLHIDSSGRLRGQPGKITYNSPWPTVDGRPGGFGTAFGGVIHTEVGFEHTVIHEFNDPASQASAFFSIGLGGHIHQYGPLGKDWEAWTQVGGNHNWRGVEHEDQGKPQTPFSDAQLWSSAQVFEAMSAFDGWPLKAVDNVLDASARGVAFHSDGGAAWGGHDCPGTVRRGQRDELIRRALLIRTARHLAPGSRWVADGKTSLADVCGWQGCKPEDIWFATAQGMAAAGKKDYGIYEGAYLNKGDWSRALVTGTVIWVP